MKVWEAQLIAGTLSDPSKMPGKAFGLPALKACPTGSKLAKIDGSVCSICYGCNGCYQFPSTIDAQDYRLAMLRTRPAEVWVEAMTTMIKSACRNMPYFRWHDSGDLISASHLAKVLAVCKNLPKIHFWLPTKEVKLMMQIHEQNWLIPKNVCIRLSAPMIDKDNITTVIAKGMGIQSSGVTKDPKKVTCRATKENGCGKCRKCWNKKYQHIIYKEH